MTPSEIFFQRYCQNFEGRNPAIFGGGGLRIKNGTTQGQLMENMQAVQSLGKKWNQCQYKCRKTCKWCLDTKTCESQLRILSCYPHWLKKACLL